MCVGVCVCVCVFGVEVNACASEETVFYMCMNEPRLTGANVPEESARVHVCVFCMSAQSCVESHLCIHMDSATCFTFTVHAG